MAHNPNRRDKITAQVHRFGDFVAIHIGTGETVYLHPRQARQLSRALNRAARSCENEAFTASTCGTASFDFSPKREA
jgi:hypothetical protein